MSEIIMYGTEWCSDCIRAKRYLNSKGIGYRYVNVELDAQAAEIVRSLQGGNRRIPTIVFPDHSFLVEPTNHELASKLADSFSVGLDESHVSPPISIPLNPAPSSPPNFTSRIQNTEASESSAADHVRDVIIIGSGPAGYTAALYTARANLSPLLIAGSAAPGGELMNTTEVENYPGFPGGITGPDLMDLLETQAARFGTEILFEEVTSIELTGQIKTVTVGTGETFRARAVIISTGSAYRELGLDDEKRLSGRGVSWCATCDGPFFKNQDVAVIGGGDSALEEALFLTKFARSVTVVHRRASLRASKIMQDRALAHEKIRFEWNAEVTSILGTETVTGLVLANTDDKSTKQLEATGVFVAIGNNPRVALVEHQLELTPKGTIAVMGRTSTTSAPGVFAAGDVIDPVYRQAITAAGSGCAAAIDVEHYLADLHEATETAAEAPGPRTEEVTETAGV